MTVLVLGASTACGTGPDGGGPRVIGARASEGLEVAAVYLTILGGDGDALVGASSPAAASVGLHGTGMASVARLDLDGEVVLEPTRDHLMLDGLARPLAPGDVVEVTLRFAEAPPVVVQAPVVAYEDLLGDEPADEDSIGGGA